VELEAHVYDSATFCKGIPAIFIGIEPTPWANPQDPTGEGGDCRGAGLTGSAGGTPANLPKGLIHLRTGAFHLRHLRPSALSRFSQRAKQAAQQPIST
jgi:hypothetical protein